MIGTDVEPGGPQALDGPTWEWMRDRVTTLGLAVRSGAESVNLGTRSGSAEFADQMRVSAGFFRVLGVPPSLGREFTPEEDIPGGPPLVVLSHGLWTRLFDSGTDAVGESVLLRGEPYTVIGVMPEGFRTVPDAALWTPLGPSTRGEGGGLNYELLARVRPGSTPEEARAELDRLAGLYDGSDAAQVNTRGQVTSSG
jgi:hypothetical protein